MPATISRGPDAAQPVAASAPPRVVSLPSYRAAAPAATSSRLAYADYSYVRREVRRIATLTAGIVLLLIVLAIVLV